MNRQVDKTKKSNIKCEHCKHWVIHLPNGDNDYSCHSLKSKNFGQLTSYYNRCKAFEWKEGEAE